MSSATTDRRMGLTGDKGMKAPARLATTGNITLSGEQTIDGVLTIQSRVLVKNQPSRRRTACMTPALPRGRAASTPMETKT